MLNLFKKFFAKPPVFTVIPTPLRPLGLEYMHPTGGETKWRKVGDMYYEVCAFCGGNCGQCGTSVGMGIPASMSEIVKNGQWDSGNHVGFGNDPGSRARLATRIRGML